MKFDFLRENDNERFLAADKIRLDYPAPLAFFKENKLASSSLKKRYFDHAHFACLRYNIITSPGGYEDLSIGFTH